MIHRAVTLYRYSQCITRDYPRKSAAGHNGVSGIGDSFQGIRFTRGQRGYTSSGRHPCTGHAYTERTAGQIDIMDHPLTFHPQ